jgi:serine/threonine protein kinase
MIFHHHTGLAAHIDAAPTQESTYLSNNDNHECLPSRGEKNPSNHSSSSLLMNMIMKKNDSLITLTQSGDSPTVWFEDSEKSERTNNVGTYFYAAPEVKNGRYDAKADIYACGVILFELFNSWTTAMERCVTLEQLRQGHIPPTFITRSPLQTDLGMYIYIYICLYTLQFIWWL